MPRTSLASFITVITEVNSGSDLADQVSPTLTSHGGSVVDGVGAQNDQVLDLPALDPCCKGLQVIHVRRTGGVMHFCIGDGGTRRADGIHVDGMNQSMNLWSLTIPGHQERLPRIGLQVCHHLLDSGIGLAGVGDRLRDIRRQPVGADVQGLCQLRHHAGDLSGTCSDMHVGRPAGYRVGTFDGIDTAESRFVVIGRLSHRGPTGTVMKTCRVVHQRIGVEANQDSRLGKIGNRSCWRAETHGSTEAL